jgi:hypothetical protein
MHMNDDEHCEWLTRDGYCGHRPSHSVRLQPTEVGYCDEEINLCGQHVRFARDGRIDGYRYVADRRLAEIPARSCGKCVACRMGHPWWLCSWNNAASAVPNGPAAPRETR